MASIEQAWKTILKKIYNTGNFHYKDDSLIKEIVNFNIFIDNPLSEIAPNYSMFSKEEYIDFIKNGVFNINGYKFKDESLMEYVSSLDDDMMIDGTDFVYTYPQRFMNYETINNNKEHKSINQFDTIINRLKTHPGSNRAIAVMYHPGFDKKEIHIPCLQLIQAIIRKNSLYLFVYFRSNDIYMAFPSNMYFISYIGLSILEELKETYPDLKFEGIYYNVSSAHYYTEFSNDVADIIFNKW